MAKEAKDKHFIKKPVYLGGNKAISTFMAQNMKYPLQAKEKGIQGSVFLRYAIDHKGIVTEAKVISSLGHGCDEEAIRLVKLLKFNVAKQFKARVLFHRDIRIWFRLSQEVRNEYSYSLSKSTTAKVPDVGNKPQIKQKSYYYTVRINRGDS